MVGDRISVGYLNKKYQTTNFFLTDFFEGHYKCPAIKREYTGIRFRARLNKAFSVWEKDGYIYILGKKDEK